MSEFNELNWKIALASVFERSMRDPQFRSLCLSDPAAAVAAVSDIELPSEFKFQFFDNRTDYLYTFLLPPETAEGTSSADQMSAMIRWVTLCTDPTTTWPPP